MQTSPCDFGKENSRTSRPFHKVLFFAYSKSSVGIHGTLLSFGLNTKRAKAARISRYAIRRVNRQYSLKAAADKRLQAETAAESDALFPAILDKALKGEL